MSSHQKKSPHWRNETKGTQHTRTDSQPCSKRESTDNLLSRGSILASRISFVFLFLIYICQTPQSLTATPRAGDLSCLPPTYDRAVQGSRHYGIIFREPDRPDSRERFRWAVQLCGCGHFPVDRNGVLGRRSLDVVRHQRLYSDREEAGTGLVLFSLAAILFLW